MISRTESGVVVARKGNRITILLKTGNKLEVVTKLRSLRLGNRCQVSFNNSTGKVTNVLLPIEHAEEIDEHETLSPDELALLAGVDFGFEELECSRRQQCDKVEKEELEFWRQSVLGDQSCNGQKAQT